MEVLPYFLPDTRDAPAAEVGQVHPRPYFLFVGRLEKIKGLQDVFPAFAGAGDTDLLILGEGGYARELKRRAGDNPRIRFLGRKSLDALTAYYRGALGLIVPSVCYETFGIILIESFRLGIPVIARRLGPFPEIVGAADGGFLFSNQEELLSAMRTLKGDPEIRSRLSKNARAAFLERWSEKPVLDAYGAAFARAAHRKGDRRLTRLLEAGALQNGTLG